MNLKRTKIVATMGPACSSKEMLTKMIQKGVDVCRMNFSHGDHAFHGEHIKTIRSVAKELNTHIAILADLQGPKLRIGVMENDGADVKAGDLITISTTECIGTASKVFMTYATFPQDVNVGEKILIDDGKITVKVVSTNRKDEVVVEVLFGGKLKSKKGVNLPYTKVSLPSLSEKDKRDLDFALSQNVEWVALSFVRNANDIHELREIIKSKGSNARIIAKIEKPEAITDIDEIIEATDAIMVARGDLGIEVPYQDVPLLQKMMIKKCQMASKPIIVATQMMESMIDGVTPSRAEVNDVANAVMDGADAVMLSGETSVGRHPDLVIETMANIVKKVEEYDDIYNHKMVPVHREERFVSDQICISGVRLSDRVNAKAIITMTHSGYTAFKLSSHRPKAYIYVFTSNKEILAMVSLIWGVKGFYYDKFESTDSTINDLEEFLKGKELLQQGDFYINVASMPIHTKGKTNTIKLSQVC
ncbi:MAG: pyruvate kinase [Bacteroidetes bacterium]|nr:pyruvate kinase [Bacteroidota bacterium]